MLVKSLSHQVMFDPKKRKKLDFYSEAGGVSLPLQEAFSIHNSERYYSRNPAVFDFFQLLLETPLFFMWSYEEHWRVLWRSCSLPGLSWSLKRSAHIWVFHFLSLGGRYAQLTAAEHISWNYLTTVHFNSSSAHRPRETDAERRMRKKHTSYMWQGKKQRIYQLGCVAILSM